ncbi:MAG: hypothetical protein A2138_22445 [Deltaproteobacteria bacterium RBG_16_71_12]|nr:MAG: hypothetical protein A2138_22445 [Deltaproteobacteria bacterium RBG_16_71_12]
MNQDDDAPELPPDDADLAPRPRAGYRSRPAGLEMTQRAALMAALVRVAAGLTGLAGTLLWLPITIATPVLAGVSILMMVTGCSSVSKATRSVYPRLTFMVAAACAAGSLIVVALTAVLGAGAFGPVRNQAAPPAGPPTVTFEPPAGR